MYDPNEIEPRISNFWEKNKIYEKAKKQNLGKKVFYYLDGPPYTSGRVHLGHAWGKSLRDAVIRFKRMQGFDVWDRPGFDMHGLPTEHKVEEKFGIKHKDEIVKFGVARFVNECEKLSLENMNQMIADFKRLGVWMSWSSPYMSITKDFISGVWWLISMAHKNKRLYEGMRTMQWCSHCATALAKHECEYKNIKEESIFVKFPIKNKKSEFLVIWTTTPWTLVYNLAVMVNPDFNYALIEVNNEKWIVAQKLLGFVEKIGKMYKIIKTIKGSELEGMEYKHPWEEEIPELSRLKKEHKKVHTVILSKEYVTLESGSGLVHCAPGCGPEDYEVGHKNNLPTFNSINEEGVFPEGMGRFSALKAKKDDKKFIDALNDFLIATVPYEHEYAHCERCHEPVVFRATVQWFFKIEDLIPEMRRLNKKVVWIPDWAGSAQFDSWLANLRDNSITKQRYWGTPIPIWKCKSCGDFIVLSSIEELEKLSKTKIKNPHKPFIDEIKIKCGCGAAKTRLPDILDVWIDAGTTSWNCLDFPRKKDLLKRIFPADLILEGKDQIRGWFNLLIIASMIAMKKHSYKAVYMHGMINDALGRKMSKSLGNYILPEEEIQKYGADALRYYMIGGASPGLDLNYNIEDLKVKHKNLVVLWNLVNYLIEYAKETKINPAKSKQTKLDLEEAYILSRLNSTIQLVTRLYEDYQIQEVPSRVEELFLELSRWYIQITREKINSKDSTIVISTIYQVLFDCLKMFSTIAPFATEEIYQKLKSEFRLKGDSIHLYGWPVINKKLINKKLEEDMAFVQKMVQEILVQREKAGLGIRWPLQSATITTKESLAKGLERIIKLQTNVKEIFTKKADEFKVELDIKLTPELESEGFTRELVRRIQELRKKSGLKKSDRIKLTIKAEHTITNWKDEIKDKVGASKLEFVTEEVKGQFKNKAIIKGKSFEFGFDKV